jgi:hypothetical protein
MPYDPVPPYDLEDLEAAPAQQSSSDNRGGEDGDGGGGGGGQQPENINNSYSSDNEIATKPNRHRAGKLTEKECCAYAFAYFLTSIVGVVLVVLIIAYFNYLARRGKK